MDFSSLSSLTLVLLIILSNLRQHSAYADDEKYKICKKPFKCGYFSNISYPFYDGDKRPDYCGYPGFRLNCSNIPPQISVTSSEKYYVVGVKPEQSTVTVARKDYWNDYCPKNLHNTSINTTLFSYVRVDENITLYYDCSKASTPVTNSFNCTNFSKDGRSPYGYFVTKDSKSTNGVHTCKQSVVVPIINYESSVQRIRDTFSLMAAFRYGFALQWNAENNLCYECRNSGGVCGHNTTTCRFTCYCPDQSYALKCPGKSSSKKTVLIGSFSTIGIGLLVVLVYYVRLRCLSKEVVIWRKRKHEVETFLKNHGAIGLQRYTYSDLKKLTNSFRNKVGEGGYGAVYKGMIQNTGDVVAVKILKKAEKNAEDFINEVASIGKTNHVNIVTLLGFCYETRHPALIYDFMPNGSLEKYLYGKNNPNSHSLSWEKLFQIAVGIGRGLEYLHRGCNTRIVHFDIKPHNILLDENFCPKISDFGLAKLCPQQESLVSLSEARGTVGYIAPEVFIRSFGGVSLKSDVYSYGMLVLEMVGCRRQAHSGGNEYRSEQYFPQYIYEQLEVVDDKEDMLSSEEKEVQKKMILVSLCCVKTNPSSRPEMSKVVEMLEGNVESLQAPPISLLALSSTFGGSSSLQSRTLFRSFSVTPTL